MYNTDKYVLVPIYLLAVKPNGIRVLYRIVKEIYLVSNLKIYMLIDNDIISLEKIVLDVSKNKAYIGSYDITADITYR